MHLHSLGELAITTGAGSGRGVCLAGERACPPEDVGGPGGYDELLLVLRNPKRPEFKHFRAWAGESFDPEVFDTKSVNARP